ncbi:Ig-like domain-containing protein [Aliivibrio sifiae]
MIKRIIILGVALITATLIQGCDSEYKNEVGEIDTGEHAVVEIMLSNEAVKMPAGLDQQLQVNVVLDNGGVIPAPDYSALTWISSDEGIATVNSTGEVKGVSPGSAKITVTGVSNGKTFTDSVRVVTTHAVVSSIDVTSKDDGSATRVTTAVGLTKSFVATGSFTDGSSYDISRYVNWSTSDPKIATISDAGVAKGILSGNVTVIAKNTLNSPSVSGTALLEVKKKTADKVVITSEVTEETIAVGLTHQYAAMVIFSNGDTQKVTTDASTIWESSDTSVVEIDDKGAAKGVSVSDKPVTISVAANVDGKEVKSQTELSVSGATVIDLQVTPSSSDIPVGLEQEFKATAILSDGTTKDVTNPDIIWVSSDTTIASADQNGVVTGGSYGDVTIKAMGRVKDAFFEGEALLHVSEARIVSAHLTPEAGVVPKGLSIPFSIMAKFTDGTIKDISKNTALTWASKDKKYATINSAGEVTGVKVGNTLIVAKGVINGFDFNESANIQVKEMGLKALQIAPKGLTIEMGKTGDFVATGIFIDGSERDVTKEVNWSTDKSPVATITTGLPEGNGHATGVRTGKVKIIAIIQDDLETFRDTADLTVDAPIWTSLVVTPPSSNVSVGIEQPFKATVFTSELSKDVTDTSDWTSSNPKIATVNENVATGVKSGNANIQAVYQYKDPTNPKSPISLSGHGVLTVTPSKVEGLQITSDNNAIAVGGKAHFKAEALMADGHVYDVTDDSMINWRSDTPDIATITTGLSKGNGVVNGVKGGTVIITARGTYDGDTVIGFAKLTVSSKEVRNLIVTPKNASVAKGADLKFQAVVEYIDGTSDDVTSDEAIKWESSSEETASIDTKGTAHGIENGSTFITASGSYNGSVFDDTVGLEVTDAAVSDLAIDPPSATVPNGNKTGFTVTATFLNGDKKDVTKEKDTSWLSSNPKVATVDSGMVTGVSTGDVTITALYREHKATASFTVTDSELITVTVAPKSIKVNVGGLAYLTADGLYSDGTHLDITSTVDWTEQDPLIATVGSGTESGNVTGVAKGKTWTVATLNSINSDTIPIAVEQHMKSILVSPSDVFIGKESSVQLTATSKYDDDSLDADITDKVSWIVDDQTVATISDEGVASIGTALNGTTTAIASLDGIDSNIINITTCHTLADTCIDIFSPEDDGNLFTSSPSVKYLDSIGGSPSDEVYHEKHKDGTPFGDFYRFSKDNADKLCRTYNEKVLGGRTNWKLASKNELVNDLGHKYLNKLRNWPYKIWYGSATRSTGNHYWKVSLNGGDSDNGVGGPSPDYTYTYVSCVSEAP